MSEIEGAPERPVLANGHGEGANPDPTRGWQPIETAPRDGTTILAWDGRSIAPVFWGRVGHPANRLAWVGGHCRIDHIDQPTHWMPLPEPPAALQETKP